MAWNFVWITRKNKEVNHRRWFKQFFKQFFFLDKYRAQTLSKFGPTPGVYHLRRTYRTLKRTKTLKRLKRFTWSTQLTLMESLFNRVASARRSSLIHTKALPKIVHQRFGDHVHLWLRDIRLWDSQVSTENQPIESDTNRHNYANQMLQRAIEESIERDFWICLLIDA